MFSVKLFSQPTTMPAKKVSQAIGTMPENPSLIDEFFEGLAEPRERQLYVFYRGTEEEPIAYQHGGPSTSETPTEQPR